MTQEELILFKELIKEAVRYAVKDAVKEELEASFKKDLKEVKVLLAKSIKESRAIMEQAPQSYHPQSSGPLPEDVKRKLREAVGGDFTQPSYTPIRSNPTMPQISSEAAMNMSVNGSLPDIDAPIPFIKKDSVMWKEMKEKIG